MKRVLIIDDDTYICDLLVHYLERNGYKATGTYSGIKGMKLIETNDYDIVLCDYRLPDSDGYKILQHIKHKKPLTSVIIMTAYADIKMAVKLIKSGAFDYVIKPIQHEEILRLLNRAIEIKDTNEFDSSFSDDFIEGKGKKIKEVLQHVNLVAPTDLTVLIEGETGSGKEYIARAIHYASKRKNKPFIAVDCGAIPKELANSELFGHIKGAFTGAISDKKGYFEQAKGGTLFLDEIGNLPYENQTKLLRALQERVIARVGDTKTIKVDVRLIAATNEDLLKHTQSDEFREDLYHRLNEFKIQIPSLRNRKEDIMEFADVFIERANRDFNKNILAIDEDVEELFYQYKWHGNIRELKNVIYRAVLLSENNTLKAEVLPDEIRFQHLHPEFGSGVEDIQKNNITELKEATFITEKEVISNALIKSNFNKSKAAKMLKIDRKTLYNKIKQYNIEISK